MVRIAPVRLTYNPRTLWFDARDLDLNPGDNVIVQTARGLEHGCVDDPVFEGTNEQVKSLKSSLKPVRRKATEEDEQRFVELEEMNREALPVFKELAAEKAPDMNPVSVEFLFDGDKAVFYFESEDRIDFRDLVRELASTFHIRVDMKQIGVRDEARMVGGIGHCGQELCCRRLGGEFNPVSIRMAKEQGMSLNPQKISGLCGRLMCCLRYEYDAYKDFHSRAPKKNAKIVTPDGEAKVVDMDVPREVISVMVEGEKPVKIPLKDMEVKGDSARANYVGEEAWAAAHEENQSSIMDSGNLLTSQLTEKDKLADPTRVNRVGKSKDETKESSKRKRRRSQSSSEKEPPAIEHKQRRRRSTKLAADGSTSVVEESHDEKPSRPSRQMADAASKKRDSEEKSESSNARRKRRSRSSKQTASTKRAADSANNSQSSSGTKQKQNAQGKSARNQAKPSNAPGRKSSSLRSGRPEPSGKPSPKDASNASEAKPSTPRRRRRSHKAGESSPKSGSNGNASNGNGSSGNQSSQE